MTTIQVGDYTIHSMWSSRHSKFMGCITYKGSKIHPYMWASKEKGILDGAYEEIKKHSESVNRLKYLGR